MLNPDTLGVTNVTTEGDATYQYPRVPCWNDRRDGPHDRWDTQAPCATCGAPRLQRANWEPHQQPPAVAIPRPYAPPVPDWAREPVKAEVDPKTLAVPAWIAIAAGAAMMLGSFLPWLTATAPLIGSFTKSGVDGGGDGVITLALGAVIAALGLAMLKGSTDNRVRGVVAPAGVLGLVLTVYEANSVNERIASVTADTDLIVASVGSGLYLIGAAAVAAIVAGILVFRD